MALSQPALAAEFFDTLPISEVQLRPMRQVQINNLGGGEILQAEIAPTLWAGSVSLAAMPKRSAARIQARLGALSAPGRSFEAYKAHQIGPDSDRMGAALAGRTIKISAFSVSALGLRLSGLPAGFDVSEGDFLSFEYDPGRGVHRAFHQVVVGGTANAAGTFSADLEVSTPIRPGAAIGAVVQLVRPSLLAVLVPGSVGYGTTVGNTTAGISFEFRQTLRP